jgi:acrylyl-CoA reductase (NADPH)
MAVYRAVVVSKAGKGPASRSIVKYSDPSELPYHDDSADVLVQVSHSALNYKDGLVLTGAPGVAKKFPIVPGIDFAGKVLQSRSAQFSAGQSVVLTGHYAGQWMDGGYCDVVWAKSSWLVALPEFLTERDAMIIGTAGFTAMQCVMHLEKYGGLARGEKGPVLVTGAAGGVGSVAVAILSHLGYQVHASTGRVAEQEAYLKKLGAKKVIGRLEKSKPLNKEVYIGVVDCVGGHGLATALASVQYGRAVASCGLAADSKLPATVMPFILRGVKLLGIDSVQAPMEERKAVWEALRTSLPAAVLNDLATVYSLDDLVGDLGERIIKGQTRGRGIVDMALGRADQVSIEEKKKVDQLEDKLNAYKMSTPAVLTSVGVSAKDNASSSPMPHVKVNISSMRLVSNL